MNNSIVVGRQKLISKLISTNADVKTEWKNLKDITARSHDMEGHAEKCVEFFGELAHNTVDQLHEVSTQCLDDHHINPEDLEIVGELSETCSQIVSKCLCLARIGRPQLRRTVNCSAMISHKVEPERFARLELLISHIQNTSKKRHYCHFGNQTTDCRKSDGLKVNVRWCAMHIWVAHSLMPLSWAFLKGKPLFPISAQKLDMCSFVQDHGWKTFQH